MKKIFGCRRSLIAILGICCLTWLGLAKGIDISGIALAIAGIVTSVAGANAYENRGHPPVAGKKEEGDVS